MASAKMLRQGSNGWYNFVNGAEILPLQRVGYTVKINKAMYKSIMIGFCTSAALGNKDNLNHAESAYYSCLGSFYEGGTNIGLAQSGVGDVIECEADLLAGVMCWLRNGNTLKECKVPSQMQEKTVFLSISMSHAGDEVEMSV
jgi:hypothetical protein